jgi:hypothetical protein
MPGNTVRFVAQLKDEVSARTTGINKAFGEVGLKTKGLGGAFDKLALSTGGLVSPTSVLAGGVLAVAGVLAEATKAAIEDDISVARLGASLKANVPAWTGSNDLIDAALRKSEDLGFGIEDLRASFSGLVGATHDIGKALDVQAVAMDLARYKGISLQDASDALTKVEAGSYRILKSLGIQLPKNATQVQALAAVEKIASGQAKAYADTTAGGLDKMKAHAHDFEVGVGDAVEHVLGGLGQLVDAFSVTAESESNLKEHARIGFGGVAHAAAEAAATTETVWGKSVNDTAAAFTGLVTYGVDELAKISPAWSADVAKMRGDMTLTKSTLKSDFADLTNYMKDRLSDPALRALLSGKSSMGQELLAGLRSSHGDVVDETGKIFTDIKGKMTTPELQATLSGKNSIGHQLQADLHSKKRDVVDAARKIIADLEDELNTRFDIFVDVHSQGHRRPGAQPSAEGGPRSAGQVLWVGEKGPELFVPGTDGTIIPNDRIGGVGGGGITLVYAPQTSTASLAEAQSFMRAIVPELTRELRRQRVIA